MAGSQSAAIHRHAIRGPELRSTDRDGMHVHAMDARTSNRTLMACLGEASRFNLVRLLIAGPRCVTELAQEVGLSQSCTTRHLQALARRRVVAAKRDGKRVLYRLRLEEPG